MSTSAIRTPRSIRKLAPAKINLHLRIGRRGADGFHPILSWMSTVGLFDTLQFDAQFDAQFAAQELAQRGEVTEIGSTDFDARDSVPGASSGQALSRISLRCDDQRLTDDASNLVIRAAEALLRAGGGRGETPPSAHGVLSNNANVAITLSKRIPIGGGLGGGSSDAATTLLALNELLQINVPREKLAAIAATLGSDVTFFLNAPSAICRGRGEIVEPIAPPSCKACLLILPELSASTPAVYRRFDELNLGTDLDDAEQHLQKSDWTMLGADELLRRLVNDLEAPAFDLFPALGKLRSDAESALGRIVRMSGSGSSLFTLFDDLAAAETAQRAIAVRLKAHSRAVRLAPDASGNATEAF